jgi:sugar lactone lactonase YvrE
MRRLAFLALVLLASTLRLEATQWSIYAGSDGGSGAVDATGTAARFNNPQGVAVDAQGNAYVVDGENRTIRKVTPAGVVTTLAGQAGMSGHVDAMGAAARFSSPVAIVLRPDRSLVVSDSNTLRAVALDGTVSTLAGTGASGHLDGPAAQATLSQPSALAVDAASNVYMIQGNGIAGVVRVLTVGGQVMTLAGSPTEAGNVDGQGSAARFSSYVRGMTLGPDGNLYVADNANGGNIRQVTPTGAVTTYASGVGAFGILADAGGNLYVAGSTVKKVDAAAGHAVTNVVDYNGVGYVDGPAAVALFSNINFLAFAADGALLAVDTSNHAIRKVTLAGDVTTLAGKGSALGSADGTGTAATFNYPRGLAVDGSGKVYVADSGNLTVRQIAPGGVVTTLAGQAGAYGTLDGTGSAARFGRPYGVAAQTDGTLYVTENQTGLVRVITPQAEVSTLAQGLSSPSGVTVALAGGSLVVTEPGNDVIRGISTPGGVVSTVAGMPGVSGATDGSGTAALFGYPLGLAEDATGTIYVADLGNFAIRKIAMPGAVVTTLAGGSSGFTDGVGAAATFNGPEAVAVDAAGNVYVVEAANHAIRKVTPSGRVITIGGNGKAGSVPGSGQAAAFNFPRGIAVAADGTLYVSDENQRIVKGVDDSTEPPLLTAPLADSVTKSPVTVTYELTEAALSGSVTVKFAPQFGPTLTLTLTGAYATEGVHTFDFNPASPVASAPAAIASISGGPFIPDAIYTVTLSYRDTLNNPLATAVAANVKLDTVTSSPFAQPLNGNIFSKSSVSVLQINLPEAALPGSVKLTFDDGMGTLRVLTLGSLAETAGSHSVFLNPATLPYAGTNFFPAISGSPVPDGPYTLTVSYQDALANPAASASVGIVVDTVTQTPTLTFPAAGGAVGGNVTVTFTLPEAAPDYLAGSSPVSVNFGQYVYYLTTTYLTAGTHSFSFNVSDPVGSSNGAIDPNYSNPNPLPDGVYSVKVTCHDLGYNVAASTTHANVRVDTAPPAFNPPQNGIAVLRTAAGTLPDYTALIPTTDDSTVTVTQSPLSSSVTNFTGQPITVTLTATDAAGNTATYDLTVDVRPADPLNTLAFIASTKAAIPGGAVPGAGTFTGLPADAKFTSLGVPSIDNLGNLAFTGKWAGSNKAKGAGIFTDTKCVALVGGAAPGGGTYLTLSDPVAANGRVAFIATLTGVPAPQKTAIFSDAPSGTLENIAQTGIDADIGGATFKAFKGVQILGNTVGFFAQVSGGSGADKITAANDLGLWVKSGTDPLEAYLREGDVVDSVSTPVKKIKTLTSFTVGAGSPGQGRGWLTNPYGVSMLAHALLDDKAKTQAIVTGQGGGNLTILSQSGSTTLGAPALTGATFQSYGFPAVNNNYGAAFLGTLTTGTGTPAVTKTDGRGIFSTPATDTQPSFGAVVRLIAAAGTTGGTFSVLKDPVLAEDGGLAFPATLKGPKGAAATTLWWQPVAGPLELLAQGGISTIPVAGAPVGAQWKTFPTLAIAATRGPLFTGTLATGKTVGNVTAPQANGVWAMDFEGSLRLLFQSGFPVGNSGKTLKSFTVLTAVQGSIGVTRSFNDAGQVTWLAAFTDGTTAIVKTVIP